MNSSGVFGTRSCGATKFAAGGWRPPRVSRFRWFLDATPPESRSLFATSARTALFPLIARTLRWPNRRMRLSWLVFRRAYRPVPRCSFRHSGFQAPVRPHLRRQLSLRGARRLCVGVFRQCRRTLTGWSRAARAGIAEIQWPLPHRASFRDSALQHGYGHHRADGSSAWPICSSLVVVAQPAQHSREAKEF